MWKKTVAPLILVGVLWLGGGGFTTYYISWLQTSLSTVLRESMVAVRMVGEMEATQWRLHTSIMEAAREGKHSFPVDADEIELAFDRALGTVRLRAQSPEEREIVSDISRLSSQYRTFAHQLIERTDASDTETQTAIAGAAHNAALVASRCKDYLIFKHRNLLASIDRHARLTGGVNALRFILFCSAPVIGVLIGLWVSHRLRTSIQRLSFRLHDAALGAERDLGLIEISPTSEVPALEKQVQEISLRLAHAASEIERSRRETERTERLAAAGELAAGVAHELRNPLTSVKLLIQTAARKQRDRPLTEKQFRILQDEIGRMEASIQGLMDLARPPKVRRRLHNVCDTLRRSLNVLRTRAIQNGVEILEGLPNERIMVLGDAEQLHQVFVNLLLNAVQAMPDGGTLRVSFGGLDTENRFCRIKFADTGAGVPPELLDRIFEPFVSGRESGYGLGLAVSRRIVEEHGGTITAINRSEGGSVFTVALPLVSIEPARSKPGSETELPVLESPATLQVGTDVK